MIFELRTETPGMIKSFGNKETEKVWKGYESRKFPPEIQNTARRKLRMLHQSHNINDLRSPPANHLEKLRGNFDPPLYSIRINDQWRVVFRWTGNDATEVEIMDYH